MYSPGRQVPNMLLEISGEITPERTKGWNQSKKNTQLWMGLVIEARFNAVKSNIAQEPGMLGPESRQIGNGQQEMARVDIDILRISELRWTGTGEFNSDN